MMNAQSDLLTGKLEAEFRTLAAMIGIYCRAHHQQGSLCEECKALLDYAEMRLDRCPYGQQKPTCNRCPIHCYKPEPKARMKEIMRYSGPRMLLPHPILAIRHLIHERREIVAVPETNQSSRHLRKTNRSQ
ncbi:nitrous oxide-stimulated promoter family protein [Vibrio sinensis]|nr:nitrous oxide-stimulated promoter family protein [Vibrio sinensis]